MASIAAESASLPPWPKVTKWSLQRDELARAVEPAFAKKWKPGRAVEIMLNIVLAGPHQFHRRADLPGNPGRLGHEVVAQPPAEAAADARHVDGDVALGDAQGRRHQLGAGSWQLRRRPEHDLAVLKVRRAVLRLEADMGEERVGIGGFHDMRGALERGRDVAVAAQIGGRRFLRRARPRVWAKPSLLCAAVGPSSQVTSSFSRARLAAHQLFATMATPSLSPCGSPPGLASLALTMNASWTPGSALMASTLALATLPPNTGHFWNTAYSMPGTVTSMPNSGCPVTIFALSTPGIGWPMILKVFGSLSVTLGEVRHRQCRRLLPRARHR